MITVLPNSNMPLTTSKRKVMEESQGASSDPTASLLHNKRAKPSPPPSASTSTCISTDSVETNTFTSRMLVQLAKSAATFLDTKRGNANGIESNQPVAAFSESPVESLTSTLLLPSSNPKCVSTQNLALIISTLTSEVSRFDVKSAFPLIHAVLRINWIRHSMDNSKFSQSYATFLVVLVSTIPS